MTDWRQKTIDTYNVSADALAQYFRGIGSRSEYIELTLAISGISNPKVVEIGCGDGRDAQEILRHTSRYIGFDPAEEAIKLARRNVPDGTFRVADAVNFSYPAELDIVFAFASILYLPKEELKRVIDKIHIALKPDGVFYISTKYADTYRGEAKQDQFGERMFYYYNPEIIEELAGDRFGTVTTLCETIGHTDWFEMVLQKV